MPHRRPNRAPRIAALLIPLAFMAPHGVHAQDDAERLELGRQVFTELAEPQCALCHTLADAEATGAIGPSLDELQPTEDQVRTAVSGGIGIMPAFGDSLSEEEIDAVAHYVATVAGGAE